MYYKPIRLKLSDLGLSESFCKSNVNYFNKLIDCNDRTLSAYNYIVNSNFSKNSLVSFLKSFGHIKKWSIVYITSIKRLLFPDDAHEDPYCFQEASRHLISNVLNDNFMIKVFQTGCYNSRLQLQCDHQHFCYLYSNEEQVQLMYELIRMDYFHYNPFMKVKVSDMEKYFSIICKKINQYDKHQTRMLFFKFTDSIQLMFEFKFPEVLEYETECQYKAWNHIYSYFYKKNGKICFGAEFGEEFEDNDYVQNFYPNLKELIKIHGSRFEMPLVQKYSDPFQEEVNLCSLYLYNIDHSCVCVKNMIKISMMFHSGYIQGFPFSLREDVDFSKSCLCRRYKYADSRLSIINSKKVSYDVYYKEVYVSSLHQAKVANYNSFFTLKPISNTPKLDFFKNLYKVDCPDFKRRCDDVELHDVIASAAYLLRLNILCSCTVAVLQSGMLFPRRNFSLDCHPFIPTCEDKKYNCLCRFFKVTSGTFMDWNTYSLVSNKVVKRPINDIVADLLLIQQNQLIDLHMNVCAHTFTKPTMRLKDWGGNIVGTANYKMCYSYYDHPHVNVSCVYSEDFNVTVKSHTPKPKVRYSFTAPRTDQYFMMYRDKPLKLRIENDKIIKHKIIVNIHYPPVVTINADRYIDESFPIPISYFRKRVYTTFKAIAANLQIYVYKVVQLIIKKGFKYYEFFSCNDFYILKHWFDFFSSNHYNIIVAIHEPEVIYIRFFCNILYIILFFVIFFSSDFDSI